jgi:RNase P/RNase MRP subunit p29
MDGRVECGVSGMIVDETRETIVIESEGVRKVVSKRPAKFMFEDGEVLGSKIAYRPQDRIKKVKA